MTKKFKIKYSFWSTLSWTIGLLFFITILFAYFRDTGYFSRLERGTQIIAMKSYLALCIFVIMRFFYRCISSTAIIVYQGGIYSKAYGFISWENIDSICLHKKTIRLSKGLRLFKSRRNIRRYYMIIRAKNNSLIESKALIQKIRCLFLRPRTLKISTLNMDVEKTARLLKSITSEEKMRFKASWWNISNDNIDIVLKNRSEQI